MNRYPSTFDPFPALKRHNKPSHYWGWAPHLRCLPAPGDWPHFSFYPSLSRLPFSYTSDTTRRRTTWLSYLSEPTQTKKVLTGYGYTHILLPSWLHIHVKIRPKRIGVVELVDNTEERWPKKNKTKTNCLVTIHLCPDFLDQMDFKWSYWLAIYTGKENVHQFASPLVRFFFLNVGGKQL